MNYHIGKALREQRLLFGCGAGHAEIEQVRRGCHVGKIHAVIDYLDAAEIAQCHRAGNDRMALPRPQLIPHRVAVIAITRLTATLKGGAVGNVCKSLLKRGLIEEVPATDHTTAWRHDEERGPMTLRATPLAYSTLGITDDPQQQPDGKPAPAPEAARCRTGTKQAAVIAMLSAEGGATIAEIMAATGWLRHTVRGFMSGAMKKKLGLEVTSEKVENRGRVYRLN